MIKFLMGLVIILMFTLLCRYYYLDTQYNNSTITDQIQADGYEILTDIIDFAKQSHSVP